MLSITLDLINNMLFKIFTSVHGRDWSVNSFAMICVSNFGVKFMLV